MDEIKLLQAETDDNIQRSSLKGVLSFTDFLDVHQKNIIKEYCSRLGVSHYGFYGGYSEAERCIAVFLPDYVDLRETMHKDGSLYVSSEDLCTWFRSNPEDDPLACISASVPKGGRQLTHRDYLGSLMSLGIKREVTGDILVSADCAHIAVLSSMTDYILSYFSKAGRENLSVSLCDISELRPVYTSKKTKNDTVASLRLDSVTASAFDLSRAKAADAIRMGLVRVNSQEDLKPDTLLEEGDILSFRGKGRAVLSAVGSRSRKDRIFITIEKYI